MSAECPEVEKSSSNQKTKNIACIGWGSLIWDARSLPLRSPWFNDGPLLSVEFARESDDGRITLVIVNDEETWPVRCLWALMSELDLEAAKVELAKREGIKPRKIADSIGVVMKDETVDSEKRPVESLIQQWVRVVGIDVAIWTKLEPRIMPRDKDGLKQKKSGKPDIRHVLDHLRGLRA